MSSFNIKLYNGKGSEALNAYVLISEQNLNINFNNQTEIWNYNDITRIDIFENNRIIISNTTKPYTIIETNNNELVTILQKKCTKKLIVKNHAIKASKGLVAVFGGLIAFLGLIIIAYFILLPRISEILAKRIPLSYEKKIGAQLYSGMIKGYTIDSIKTQHVQAFFDSMNITADTIKITVVKNKEINAFALPGGYIVVYDSILKVMKSPEELAALLAHEYSHVQLRHSIKGMARNMGGAMFLSLILSDMGGLTSVLISNAENLKTLQYSRTLEKEADLNAITLMDKQNINPNGALHLFENLKKVGGTGHSEFLSTHPLFNTRTSYIKEHINTHKKYVCPNRLEKLWLQIIN